MAEVEMMPEIAESSSAGADAPRLSFLSAKWVNQRIMNVADQVDKYIERIIDRGLLVDGFAPFESPITDEALHRLDPVQFRSLYDSEPTLEGKAALLARMKNLKLPIKELLPFVEDPFKPSPSLDREPSNTVSSSEATI